MVEALSSSETSVGWDCEDGGSATLVDTYQHYISHISEADNMNIIYATLHLRFRKIVESGVAIG